VTGRHARSAGFTLLEMLVVLTLLAIFAVTLAGGLRFGVQAERHVGSKALSNDALWRAERFLGERLSAAQPVWVHAQPRGRVAFTGGPADMAFMAPTPQSFGGVGLAHYLLHVETDGHLARLSVRVSTARPGEAAPAPLGSAELLNGVLSIHFSYYGRTPDGSQFGWQSDWVDRHDMPQLISIHAEPSRADRQIPIDMMIRPRVDIGVECQLNVQTASCLGQ